MRINIREKFVCFSHEMRQKALLLGTRYILEIFPTKICLGERTLFLHWGACCIQFTVVNELETGKIVVFGKTEAGFFRYSIKKEDQKILVHFEKDTSQKLKVSSDSEYIQKGKYIFLPIEEESIFPVLKSLEKLSFGMHKKQEIEGIKKRQDLKEIMPLLYTLGQWYPAKTLKENSCSLLKIFQDSSLLEKERSFLNLFNAGFSHLLVPRCKDEECQGFDCPPFSFLNPFLFAYQVFQSIREHFIKEEEEALFILPKLLKKTPCGRMTHLLFFQDRLKVRFEWSSLKLFRAILLAVDNVEFRLELPKDIKSFRTRRSLSEKGFHDRNGARFFLEEKETLFLDHFLH